MPALDTDILVRHVVDDDPTPSSAARQLIGRCVAEGLPLFVPLTVVLELEWVLRKRWGLDKGELLRVLSSLRRPPS